MANVQPIRSDPLTRPASQSQMKAQLRDVFREAFDRLGGADWLVEFAQENDGNARVFVQAVTKLIPISAKLDMQFTDGQDLSLITTEQLQRAFLASIGQNTGDVIEATFAEVQNEPADTASSDT